MLEALAAVRLELVERVELAGQLREVVVQLGEFARRDGGDLDGDLGLLALGGAALELGGEGGLAAGLQAGDGLVDAVEQLAGADRVRDAAGDAVLQDLAVDLGLEVDRHDVALGGGALDRVGGGEALTQLLDRLLDVLVA